MTLFAHQQRGVDWLASKPSAGLFWEMGCGKSRSALFAARKLFDAQKIDRVLVLAPSSVLFAWREELGKLSIEGFNHNLLAYDAKEQVFRVEAVGGNLNQNQRHMPIALVSYSLLQREHHKKAAARYANLAKTALICDESSFLKNRTAKQTKATYEIATVAAFRWLLSGTPVCNSPLDLYAQGKVMAPNGSKGPLSAYKNFYHFRSAYGTMGGFKMKEWTVNSESLPELTRRFAPYVSRVEKKDCLDLPPKSYTVREIALTDETWKIYVELKRECMLSLPDSEAKPEPNAAVRILRLCQLTSGHVGGWILDGQEVIADEYQVTIGEKEIDRQPMPRLEKDISSEKLDYLADSILNGELANEKAIIVWCRWRRERERLATILRAENEKRAAFYIGVWEIFGGQSQVDRESSISCFQTVSTRRVLIAQPHSGGFGLNLTAASTAIFLSNDFSHSTRVQAEDRIHRIGQHAPCLYVDVVAVGPKGQRTIDAHILEALRAKKSIAEWTCAKWKAVLDG